MINKIYNFLRIFVVIILISCNNKHETKLITQTDTTIPEISDINQKIKLDPNNPELYKKRAEVYIKLKKIDEALLDINRALTIDSSKAAYFITRSDIYFAGGQVTKCKESLQKALIIDPKNEEAILKLAELYFYFKDYNNTFEFLNKAYKLNPNNAKVWFMRGMTYKDMGDTNKAIKSLTEAVQIDQNNYEAYLYLGILYAGRKNPLAIEYYKNALNIKPAIPEALYNLGLFYQETGDYDKAIQTYTMITTQNINPDSPQYIFLKHAYYNMGYINLQYTQLYMQAVKHFTSAINIDPYFVEAYYNRGYSYELMGDVIKARKDYEKALKIRVNYDMALQGLNRLDKLDKTLRLN